MEIIKNKRILALVGIIGLIISCFLPYYNISVLGYKQSISLWGYWEGKIILLLTLANALFIFQDIIETKAPNLFNNSIGKMVQKANNPKIALIPTILAVVFAVLLIIRVDVDSEYVKYGLGFWVLWIGIIALIGHAIFYKKQQIEQNNTNIINNSQMQQNNTNVINDSQMQQNVNIPVQNMNTKFCTSCGNQMNMSDTICSKCGKNF